MENTVVVSGTKEGKYTQDITVGNHKLIADEPIEVSGKGLGPSPYELLLSSLGACKAITLRMYADLKKIPLDKTIIKLEHSKVYAEDCQNCEANNGKIDMINVQIELQGNLTQEQRTKLLEIADKCPVHKTLTSQVTINTTLV